MDGVGRLHMPDWTSQVGAVDEAEAGAAGRQAPGGAFHVLSQSEILVLKVW